MDGKDTLTRLSQGACPTEETPQQVVVVQKSQPQAQVCPTGPTEAVLVDSNKIANGVCVEASFPVTNASGATQTLRFGAFGNEGDYQLLGESPIASDTPTVTSDDYAAGGNVIGIQRFNYLVQRTPVIIKYFRVRGVSDAQKSQRLKYKTFYYDKDSNCSSSFISPACSDCANDNDDNVRTFEKILPLDGLHAVDYPILDDETFTIEIGIVGAATARNYVPCNSKY